MLSSSPSLSSSSSSFFLYYFPGTCIIQDSHWLKKARCTASVLAMDRLTNLQSGSGCDVADATEHGKRGRNKMGTSTYFTAAAPTIAHARQQLDYLLDAPEPANQIARAVATEHSILLSRDQARGLASKARRQHAPGNLHNLARAALNRITAAGPKFPSPDVHKLDDEFPWQS